uniref:SCP domain-containing protein n=1 Tax=Electrophorus electricus TaxID=8005 RepID=A0A4W4E0Y3_ELEEL
WSKEVAASSQDWANTCAMAHGPPSSRMIRGYQMGENLFQSTTPLTWTDVVTAWHSEYKNYKYGFGSINGKSIGHYTQVVWYSSYKVGCGIAKCGDRYFYSCRYYRTTVPICGVMISLGVCFPGYECVNNKLSLLKQQGMCKYYIVKKYCTALCLCSDKIIPVGKK